MRVGREAPVGPPSLPARSEATDDHDDIDNDDDDEIQANMFEQVKGTTKATS